MKDEINVRRAAVSRIAIPARPPWVRILVPAGVTGLYLLVRDEVPIYVGRSDSCLQTRLTGHELLIAATHVVWEPCPTENLAYELEAYWYHKLKGSAGFVNQIHPARPMRYDGPCPFCVIENWVAGREVPLLKERSAASEV